MEKREIFTVNDIVLIGLFVALITICSFIRIPLGTIPFTLQTFGIFVTAGLLGTKRGVAAVVVYILMGAIGVPVFGGAGGPAVLFGSTGGYITGFIFTALIIGVMSSVAKKSKGRVSGIVLVCSMVIGDLVCCAIGTIQFMILTDMSLIVSLGYCVIPFIVPDIIKIVVAVCFIEAIRKADNHLFR